LWVDNWGGERCVQGFGGETWGKEHLEDPDVDGRIILRSILRNGWMGMDWIDVV